MLSQFRKIITNHLFKSEYADDNHYLICQTILQTKKRRFRILNLSKSFSVYSMKSLYFSYVFQLQIEDYF